MKQGKPLILSADHVFRNLAAVEQVSISPEITHLVLTSAEFISRYTTPEYVIDGVLQRGYLYSLTARTGHGKTAVDLYVAQCIARGVEMHGQTVKPGSVLYLAGENPDDIRARFLVLSDIFGFDPKTIPIHFVEGVVNVAVSMPAIREAAEKIYGHLEQ